MSSNILNTTARFGLVEFPVAINKATERTDVKFDRAVKLDDGSYEKVKRIEGALPMGAKGKDDQWTTGFKVGATETNVVKGVWQGEEFHEIPADAIARIGEEGQLEALEIEEFIPAKMRAELFPRAQDTYHLTPQKGLIGAKPLRLLHEAMRLEKTMGVAKFALKKTGGRQKLGVIYPENGKVMLTVLTYAGDYRQSDEAAEAIANVDVDKRHLAAARKLIAERRIEGGGLIEHAEDDAVAAKQGLLEEALAGKLPAAKPEKQAPPSAPDDLMAQLEASVKARKKVPA